VGVGEGDVAGEAVGDGEGEGEGEGVGVSVVVGEVEGGGFGAAVGEGEEDGIGVTVGEDEGLAAGEDAQAAEINNTPIKEIASHIRLTENKLDFICTPIFLKTTQAVYPDF